MKNNCCSSGGGERPGYVLIFCMLFICIAGMWYWYRRAHGPVYQIGKGRSDIEVPWRQWYDIFVRTQKGRPPGEPTAEQPQLSQSLSVAAKPEEDGQQRGSMLLFILPDGTVQGQWGGQFRISKDADFQVMGCQFKGLVDPEEVYSDEQGEDLSKLFFITKGRFTILETNDATGKVRKLAGNIYVRGWLSLDGQTNGELILTCDEKNFYLYIWQGNAEMDGGLLM